jgi:hypothetical protein
VTKRMRQQKYESDYRGYRIEMERRDLCWKVSLKPTHSDLPIVPHPSFGTITQSKREALKMARKRVDQVLADACLR